MVLAKTEDTNSMIKMSNSLGKEGGSHNNNNNNITKKNNGEDQGQSLLYARKLSSVGPAKVTGEVMYEPSNMDLAMKLHYVRLVYLFEGTTIETMTTPKMKEAIFTWLNYYYESCGRLRRNESDGNRPYIKCNDCGVRFVEAKSSKTLQEWLQLGDNAALHRLLVPDNVIGPELTFSPTVFLQMTMLKCGGIAMGLSWAHILGDAYSAAEFINSLGQFLKGLEPKHPVNRNKSPRNTAKEPTKPSILGSSPISVRQVSPVGDHWTFSPPCDMGTFSFHVTPTQLAQLNTKASPFEALSAAIWRAIARFRDGHEPSTVTVITRGAPNGSPEEMLLRNNQVVSSVKAHFPVAKADIEDLVMLIRDQAQDERAQIEEVVGQDPGGSDFIIYGSNLTFVDLGGADFYGFEIQGMNPRLVNCFVDGIGEEGVVLVLPGPKNDNEEIGYQDMIVTLILPKVYMEDLKKELKEEWGLIA